jgi:23S rRNA (uracil1939-C5)-methyltransferase
MRKSNKLMLPEEVYIHKLVHGGQGLAELKDGRKVFVWNALPGERALVRVIKHKRTYAEAIAEEIIENSTDRIDPKEANYLATSPWQMMTFNAENTAKQMIVEELFTHEKVELPKYGATTHTSSEWNYRNKMEYSFWGDDDGLHLALHQRGSHGKQIVQGSKLALAAVDIAANALLYELKKLDIRAGDLKTVIIRTNQVGEAVASLFVKPKKFLSIPLSTGLKGLRIYHSNPKSPASVRTALITELGDCTLTDKLLGKSFIYDVDSFFQVNIPIFEKALSTIKSQCSGASLTDMYAGVGAIGLSIATKRVNLIELDPATAQMARINAAKSDVDATVVEASTESVLDYITGEEPVIFDPPRAGLHRKVIDRIFETLPQQIVYLSCNPATHARDLAILQEAYTITYFEIFNFFPRTPHIETLAILKAK